MLPAEVEAQLNKWIEDGRIDLPALPAVTSELLSLTFDVDCDIGKVEKVLERDQHLASQVLRVANSSMFATASQIRTLRRAMVQIGIARIRDVALRVSCESRVFRVVGFEDDVATMLAHTKTTAFLARTLAEQVGVDPDEAFILGLLHDIGRPVVLQALVDLIAVLKLKLRRKITLDLVSARDALARHHERVGATLLRKWQLPEMLATVVGNHHAPDRIEDEATRSIAWLIRLADVMEHNNDDEVEVARKALGIDLGVVVTVRGQIDELRAIANAI